MKSPSNLHREEMKTVVIGYLKVRRKERGWRTPEAPLEVKRCGRGGIVSAIIYGKF